MNPKTAGIAQLILVTIIWGATFPLNAFISNDVNPILAIAIRFAIASLPLLRNLRRLDAPLIRDGIILGLLGCITYVGQMMSLQDSSVNRAAILSSLHVIFVPIVLKLLGKSVPLRTFMIAGIALIGVVAMKPELDLGHWAVSDIWAIVGAVGFALGTLKVEACAGRHDCLRLTSVQVCTMALLLGLIAIPSFGQIPMILGDAKILGSLLYLGLGATLLATILQTKAQRSVGSCQSSAILSLEPVTTAGFAWGIVGQVPSGNEVFGGSLVMLASLLMNVPLRLPVWLSLVRRSQNARRHGLELL